jgi:hypothetical protein
MTADPAAEVQLTSSAGFRAGLHAGKISQP